MKARIIHKTAPPSQGSGLVLPITVCGIKETGKKQWSFFWKKVTRKKCLRSSP